MTLAATSRTAPYLCSATLNSHNMSGSVKLPGHDRYRDRTSYRDRMPNSPKSPCLAIFNFEVYCLW